MKVEAGTLLPAEGRDTDEAANRVKIKAPFDGAGVNLIVEKIETEQMLVELLDYHIDFAGLFVRRAALEPRPAVDPVDCRGAPVTTPILQGMHAVAGATTGSSSTLGVVHDGVTVFPGVIDALERLRDASKKLVFL